MSKITKVLERIRPYCLKRIEQVMCFGIYNTTSHVAVALTSRRYRCAFVYVSPLPLRYYLRHVMVCLCFLRMTTLFLGVNV